MSGKTKIKIAIPVGDPAGIGPEICLKAALDPAVRAACDPILVCDPDVLARHTAACAIKSDVHVVERVGDADWSRNHLNVLACRQPDGDKIPIGKVSAAAGRASIAFCAAAVNAAM